MRADRLLGLLVRLQARGKMTAEQLADELEVSVRTIYRDLGVLSAAGVPVVTTGGPGGGCQLLGGYRHPLLGVTTEEATALLAAATSEPLEQLGLGGSLTEARLHLLASLPPAARAKATSLAGRFLFDAPAWFNEPEPVPCLTAMVDAVRDNRRLRIHHERSGRGRRSTVEPLGLVAKSGVWYLVARSSRRLVAHRAARITRAETLDESFERPDGFDLARFWAQWTGEFEARFGGLPVTLRACASAAVALAREFQRFEPGIPDAPVDKEGWRTLTVWCDSTEHACQRLLGFGADVEVLAPAGVRAGMLRAAQQIVARYHPAEANVQSSGSAGGTGVGVRPAS